MTVTTITEAETARHSGVDAELAVKPRSFHEEQVFEDASSTKEDDLRSLKHMSVSTSSEASDNFSDEDLGLERQSARVRDSAHSHTEELGLVSSPHPMDEEHSIFELDAGPEHQIREDELDTGFSEATSAQQHQEVRRNSEHEMVVHEDVREGERDESEDEEDDEERGQEKEDDDKEEQGDEAHETDGDHELDEGHPLVPTPTKLHIDTPVSHHTLPISGISTSHMLDRVSISPTSPEAPRTPTNPVSPITEQEADLSRDSMSSVALSQSSLDYDHLSAQQVDDGLATPRVSGVRHLRKPSSVEIFTNHWSGPTRQSTLFDTMKDDPLETPDHDFEQASGESMQSVRSPTSKDSSRHHEVASLRSNSTLSASFTLGTQSRSSSVTTPRRASSSSSEDNEVDWSQLDKNEEQEKEDKELAEGAEDESTAFLLARLEQENAKYSTDPKSSTQKVIARERSGSRPPSMGHLKKLVRDRHAPSIRYSLAPDDTLPEEPPPMTELEFWAALVQDYLSTAVRLPTLTTTKIRSGIPPPLRGVVWASISGARERALEDAFDNLVGERSPYEGIINKDVGRSFPGVELFRDADGEGQRMLGRVLKCFSLHDKDIGYCQGLGFLVGPLLMNMGEKEAFCVLVRLMDHYALRPSFLPSLSGLHMRIYQFSSLLKQHHPRLSEHFTNLGVEPAYISQWFLSCFAVTCPLPMLFRIYDVIFAEGANETVMRVALALIRRNEETMLASNEFEEVMQLLLGRAIWDSYGCNADDLVDDFTSLGNIITHARLGELEREFEDQSSDVVGHSAGFLPDVQAAASRFLGRLWAPVHAHTPSKSTSTLSPHSADASVSSTFGKPSFRLRKSPSKQSISTVNETEGSSNGSNGSIASTAPTEIGTIEGVRDSNADMMSLRSKSESIRTASQLHSPFHKEQQDLHTQIEDLLMAMSEMQREHAELTAMLQQEREDRSEDHRVVRQLVEQLKPNESSSDDTVSEMQDRRRTLPPPSRMRPVKQRPVSLQNGLSSGSPVKARVNGLLHRVEERLASNTRFSASYESKAQLRSSLAQTREQLAAAQEHSRELATRLEVAETSLPAFQSESDDLRAEVKELRSRVNDEFKARQKLEYTVQEMKAEARSLGRRDRLSRISGIADKSMSNATDASNRQRTTSVSSAPTSMMAAGNGLRELKLGRDGRRDSSSSIQSMRVKSRLSELPSSPPQLVHAHTMPSALPKLDVTITSDNTEEEQEPSTPFSAVSITPSTPGATPSLAVPASGFGARTSSLATQDVFATPEHESVPEEALLLELVNAKTAEAQAKQEVDEMRRTMNIQKRRHDEALQRMQAEFETARLEFQNSAEAAERAAEEAQKARLETEHLKLDLERVRLEAKESLLMTPSISLPGTPALFSAEDYGFGRTPTHVESAQKASAVTTSPAPSVRSVTTATPPATTAAASTGVGWFWSRRTASTAKAVLEDKKDGATT